MPYFGSGNPDFSGFGSQPSETHKGALGALNRLLVLDTPFLVLLNGNIFLVPGKGGGNIAVSFLWETPFLIRSGKKHASFSWGVWVLWLSFWGNVIFGGKEKPSKRKNTMQVATICGSPLTHAHLDLSLFGTPPFWEVKKETC